MRFLVEAASQFLAWFKMHQAPLNKMTRLMTTATPVLVIGLDMGDDESDRHWAGRGLTCRTCRVVGAAYRSSWGRSTGAGAAHVVVADVRHRRAPGRHGALLSVPAHTRTTVRASDRCASVRRNRRSGRSRAPDARGRAYRHSGNVSREELFGARHLRLGHVGAIRQDERQPLELLEQIKSRFGPIPSATKPCGSASIVRRGSPSGCCGASATRRPPRSGCSSVPTGISRLSVSEKRTPPGITSGRPAHRASTRATSDRSTRCCRYTLA